MSVASVAATERPLRRDAAQNRERLLLAASEVFADRGLEAGVEEIARVAGVGMGTLYRRFPTKEALIAAIVDDMLDTMVGLAESALDQPEGRGLETYLRTSSGYQAEHRGCLPKLWSVGSDHAAVRRVRGAVTELLEDAKRHGRARGEATATDISMVMWSIRGVIETTRDVAPDAWQRHLEILLAGLRPGAEVLSHPPMSRQQVDKVIAAT